ncbi:MAG: Asp-tRNA(Asn)/Glu-tRNA(Gln) amidotransferase subunit GatB [Candidatus Dojkabacteria bacterium]|nr:Asp-tRNA(Asn)/Glu-tRNA(Gln) amidotransferase subunit GatB [Candidatus Dojkabacteria bacterium]
MNDTEFIPIIGLEIHVQLKTASKLFCSCSTDEADPNSNVCEICLAYPGSMPSLNLEGVRKSIMAGIALNSHIADITSWDRKSYMYPDLFKGYQISQYDRPICYDGNVEFIVRSRKNYYSSDAYIKRIGIFRAHLEEDTAKSTHEGDFTYIDANKAGIPLLEIVTKPELYSVDEAVSFAKKVRDLMRWFDISECDMEKGHMRFDANISICVNNPNIKSKSYEEWEDILFTPIVEIKNLNSFGNLEAALEYEIKRQIEEYKQTGNLYSKGQKETRGFDADKGITYIQRKKEEANEYRYIPEPDIPYLEITQEDIDQIKSQMGITPLEAADSIRSDVPNISEYVIELILGERRLFDIYIDLKQETGLEPRKLINLITNELKPDLDLLIDQQDKLSDWLNQIIQVLIYFRDNKVSQNQLKIMFSKHQVGETDFEKLLSELKNDEVDIDLQSIVNTVVESNPSVVEQIKGGKESAKMFLVGQVMKITKGKADPNEIKSLIDKKINEI